MLALGRSNSPETRGQRSTGEPTFAVLLAESVTEILGFRTVVRLNDPFPAQLGRQNQTGTAIWNPSLV